MAIIQYHCMSCGTNFEDFRNIHEKDQLGKCVACGSDRVKKLEECASECGCGCGCDEPGAHMRGHKH